MSDDLFSRIKVEVPPENYELTTAEGRFAWDEALREWISGVEPDGLKRHLGQMVKNWRRESYGQGEEKEITSLGITPAEAAKVLLKAFEKYRGLEYTKAMELKGQNAALWMAGLYTDGHLRAIAGEGE